MPAMKGKYMDTNNMEQLTIMKPVSEVKSQDEARQIAIDWQTSLQDESPSYSELAEDQVYFELLAKQFDLVEEFKENGII
jgi:hypothetical protein